MAKLKVQKSKIDVTSADYQRDLMIKTDKLKQNQSTLIDLQREDCRQTMAVDTVEIVDNVDKGYWRRQNSSSDEDGSETESEAAMSMPKSFSHLEKR